MCTYFKFVVLAASVLLGGCGSSTQKKTEKTNNSKVEKSAKTYHIHLPEKGEDTLRVSSFADTVLYVPLETNSQSLIRRIVQVQLTDQYIFVNSRHKLLMFDYNGKFIRQIWKSGRGPGEYLLIYRFRVVHDTVYISSTGKRSVAIYDTNGHFIKEQPTPMELAFFNVEPDGKFVAFDRPAGTLVEFDRQLNVLDTIVVEQNVSPKRTRWMVWDEFDSYFYKSRNRLLFTDYLNDTIWNISNGKKKVAYILNLGKKLLPWKFQSEYFDGDFNKFMKVAAAYDKIGFAPTSSYLFLMRKGYVAPELSSIYVRDLNSGMTRKFNTGFIYDDLVGKRNLMEPFSSHDCLMAVVNPFKLKEELKKKQAKSKVGKDAPSPAWLKQMSKVKEDDNPILVIIHPKPKQ